MSKEQLSSQWTKHLKTDEEREKFSDYIRNSTDIRTCLTDILGSKRRKPKEGDYDSPNWALKRAHDDGYNKAIDELLTIIKVPDHKG